MRLFFFGSLMDADLLRLVLDREIEEIEHAAAEILGYERRRAKNESFPIIVPTPGGRVEGRLVTGLTAADVARHLEDFPYDTDAPATLDPAPTPIPERRTSAR